MVSATRFTPQGPAKWKITGQSQRTAATTDGRYVPGVTVHFQLEAGTSSSVFVPDSQYNADNVRTLVQAKAAEMAKVAALRG